MKDLEIFFFWAESHNITIDLLKYLRNINYEIKLI